jgi:hypothetical protein
VLGVAGTVAIPFVHFELPLNVPNELARLVLLWAWTAFLAITVFVIQRRSRSFLHLRGFGLYDAVEGFAAIFLAVV